MDEQREQKEQPVQKREHQTGRLLGTIHLDPPSWTTGQEPGRIKNEQNNPLSVLQLQNKETAGQQIPEPESAPLPDTPLSLDETAGSESSGRRDALTDSKPAAKQKDQEETGDGRKLPQETKTLHPARNQDAGTTLQPAQDPHSVQDPQSVQETGRQNMEQREVLRQNKKSWISLPSGFFTRNGKKSDAARLEAQPDGWIQPSVQNLSEYSEYIKPVPAKDLDEETASSPAENLEASQGPPEKSPVLDSVPISETEIPSEVELETAFWQPANPSDPKQSEPLCAALDDAVTAGTGQSATPISPAGSHSSGPAQNRNRGLVLGGGGAKGCYHVGAWQAFEEQGIQFDAVSGTSIGALVGSFYVQQNIEAVTDFVMGMTPTEIARELPHLPMTVKEKVKGTKTILEFIMKYKDDKMDITPLKNHFDTLFQYDRFERSPIAYACMTFNDTRQEPRGFLKEEITADNAKDIIMASAACYPAFPKVEMEGEIYMDGGYADNVPIELLHQAAPEIQNDHITVIDIHGPNDPVPPALTAEMFYIQPLLDPGNSIDFSSEHALRLYNQGYLETLKYLNENPGYLYTFLKEDASLIQVMEQYLDSQMEQHQIVLPDAGHIADHALRAALGYTPNALHNDFSEGYEYGKLIEALALMARVEPVALYDYRSFLKEVVENLGQLSLTNVPSNDYKMLEMLSNLKRDELTVQLHKMLVNGQGKFPSAIERMKERIPTSYTLAYIWYFSEELVKNLS